MSLNIGLVFATPRYGSLELCERLDLKLYKVSSLFRIIPLLEQIIKTRKPLILLWDDFNKN